MNTSIFAAEKSFDIGSRVVKWDEENVGISFYKRGMKYGASNDDFETLSQRMTCFVLHHAVAYTHTATANALIGRGLSVTFILADDDVNGCATLYQCLNLKDAGYSHKPLNFNGPGIEIALMPEASKYPNAYNDLNMQKMGLQPHTIVDDTVHGVTRKVFGPTKAQIATICNLLWGFAELFPDVPRKFPHDQDGKPIKTVVKNPVGFLNHYNITTEKMDCSGFPHDYVEEQVVAKLKLGY